LRKQSSDALHAIGYAIQSSQSDDAVIRVYDDAGNVIETHEHAGCFSENGSAVKMFATTG